MYISFSRRRIKTSCANDGFYIKDKHYSNINYKIPCRWCINCRIDRKKQWEERCNYEFKKHISGAFVTFTYQDKDLPMVKGNDDKIRATLRVNEARAFIERLRKYIENHEEIQDICTQKDFTYLGVGEYGQNGEIFDRPHYHILFFGLDFYKNRKLFEQEWQKGLIDSLPILQGGIGYVLKYIDKQIMGKQARFDNYLRWGIEPPKQFNSKGLGSELYKKYFKEAEKNNGKIKFGMKNIIVPQYYKQKGLMKINQRKLIDEKIENLKNYNKKLENPNNTWSFKEYQYRNCLLNKEAERMYKIRERGLLARAQANGEKIYIPE